MAQADDRDDKFAIDIEEGETLHRDDIVEHREYGPMHVSGITVGPFEKRAELKSEMGPEALQLSEDEVREQWGETIHFDPAELHEPGTVRLEHTGISVEGVDVEVDLMVQGAPQKDAESIDMHAVDQIVKAMQAVRNESQPDECEGAGYEIDWEKRHEIED